MDFEILKRSHVKRNILIAVIVVFILSAVILTFTKAKYRVTESIPLIQGTINFSPSDLNLMAVYLNKNGETISSDKVPHVGYTLNTEQSICEVNDEKDETIEIVYENGLLNFNGLGNKGTKCTAYFDLIPDDQAPTVSISTTGTDTSVTVTANASDNIGIYYYYFQLDEGEEIRSEENTYTFNGLEKDSVHTITVRVEDAAGNEASGSDEVIVGLRAGVYILASTNPPTEQTTDWTRGTSYYYIGNPNNWIQFAGFWWRIIRINGDGSIRMIYQGTSTNTTGTGTQIGTSAFNSSDNNKTYVGLVHDGTNQHGYGQPSTVMNMLNNWYNNNLVNYEGAYIDTGVGFCSDRNVANGDSWNSTIFNYAPYERIAGSASLKCSTEDILSQDNGKLPNPIGLITSDEYILSGNSASFLNVDVDYWTMSPGDYYSGSGVIKTYGGKLISYGLTNIEAVRPVINLRADVPLTGSGTTSDPFKLSVE